GVTAPVDVTYFWATQAIEIEGELYPATLADPVNDSFLVVPGNAKPGFANKAPVNGADITVVPGGASELVMKDANSPAKLYTYNLAIRIGIDGGKWLIDDPRIINTGVTRLYSYEEQTSA
ncbi:MAG TPA: hypothetical protein VK839_01290, partial [Erythrobacter sp.]|nr:hypothetical protein [Erythrobacter sp.]